MTQLAVLAVVVAVVAAATWWRRTRRGRVRAADDTFHPSELRALGVPADTRAVVEFTTPACRDCDTARAVVEQAAGPHDDVVVRTVDVAASLDLARAHRVLRAPTVFVLEADGGVAGRIVGVPRAEALEAALGGVSETDAV